ncbi:MAG: 2,5-diamino-6-(ribosylamino)-4(3H)-pyrimidinone 5'-phosphate reductase [Methanobacteriota archaeon]
MHVHANAAMSLDGKLATRLRRQTRLSCPEDMARVHRLRAASDAILVGVGTVLADDPSLLVKVEHAPGASHPVRVVLDSRGRTPPSSKVLEGPARTIVVVASGAKPDLPRAEILECGEGAVHLPRLLAALEARGIRRLLVEGGATVLASFFASDLVDELTVYIAPVVLGGKDAPTLADGEGAADLVGASRLRILSVAALGPGVLLHAVRP